MKTSELWLASEEFVAYLFTFVVYLETYGAHAFIRLEVKPHLMCHAYDEVRNKAARQTE